MSNPQDLLADIQNQLMTDEERQAQRDKIKAESYMRWLAFYYLGRREHSQKELRDKLIAKACDPAAIEALLVEFAEEGYQSDERMTSALIKEGIRKHYGHQRILQSCKTKGLKTLKSTRDIDTWITEHHEFFPADMTGNTELKDVDTSVGAETGMEIDWLKQAVAARCRKYGEAIPTEAKEKGKQLRFLQYRGFTLDVCFTALKYNLENLDQHFD